LGFIQEHMDFAVVVEHVVALDHVGVVHVPEDLDLQCRSGGARSPCGSCR
jgi:hypothetical protein